MIIDHCPVILSTCCDLSANINIAGDKKQKGVVNTWNAQSLCPTTLEDSGHRPPEFSSHGCFSITVVSVLADVNFVNAVEVADCSAVAEKQTSKQFAFQRYLNEVFLKSGSVDFVFRPEVFSGILDMFLSSRFSDAVHNRSAPSTPIVGQSSENASSAVDFVDMPALHIDIDTVRIFFPSCEIHPAADSEACRQTSSSQTTLNHDFVLLQMSDLRLQPEADNPLPRHGVHAGLFQFAAQSGMQGQMALCVRDRQFQLRLNCLSLSSGNWVICVCAR